MDSRDSDSGSGIEPGTVRAFCDLVLSSNAFPLAHAHLQRLRARGFGLKQIYLELLAPVARELGYGWDTDKLNFAEVTHGLLVLQSLLQDLSAEAHAHSEQRADAPTAVFMPGSGSHHTFGMLMVAEFFRMDGWNVWADPQASLKETLTRIGEQSFDVIGFSLGSEQVLDRTRLAIAEVRKRSLNRNIRVLVGGPVFAADPSRVRELDADALALDAQDAVRKARELLARARH
ncbi:MAG: cobalamin B12-binding domain-containing protein [Betaproteobacteria bacterium]|jgi:MerR family transcriptional regulator, light-induced transcriptional regulator|nr:cobalamin B12-binding domain-containing protein [Betaproteobacteria bacterium]NBS46948.1 cobalamin B12-binding domain-containing protein [Betaproteobacteria bacterium]